MTDTQLVVATLLPIFVIAFLAAFYALDLIMSRLRQNIGHPLEKIEQHLYTINASLCEANRHRENFLARIDHLAERR
jgi:hypothetical protein